MNTKNSSPRRAGKAGATWMLGLACLAVPAAYAQDAAKKAEPKADDVELRNWIEVGVGGNLVHGDKAAFQQRTGQPRDGWGVVTDFHYEMDVGKKGLFEVDGRGLYDADNYSITLGIKDPDRGYFKAGFEKFRTYYDLSGGYFPPNRQFINLYPEPGEVDRTRIFFEAGLTLENKPQVRVRYDYDGREGDKSSTFWGNTSLTGGAGARNIVPSINRLNEDRHTIALDISHQIGNTEAGVGGRYAFSTYDNARYMRRSPGERTGSVTAAADRFLTHREGVDTDLASAHAYTDTDLNDKLKLTTGYAFTRLDTEISGSRAIGGAFDGSPSAAALTAFTRRQTRDHGFFGLSGGSAVDQHVATISLMYRPSPQLTIVPSLRIESQEQTGEADFVDVEVNNARVAITEDVRNTRERSFLDVSQSLEARYSGVTNWMFYVRAELLEGSGDLRETDKILEETAYIINRDTHSSRFTQKYVAGANWYPHRRVNVATQYYHKVRENDYDLAGDLSPAAAGFYPAYIENQKFTTEDANLRVTLRPFNNVTLVSRYDLQYTTIGSKMQNLPEAESGRGTSQIFTEGITWFPIPSVYVQASGSYTLDRLSSPANEILGRLQVAENNYYTIEGSIGWACTEKTDVTANYGLYLADNYQPGISAQGLALGASLEEHTVGCGLAHRFNKRLQLHTRYAFMTSHDESSGGRNDFDAHLISTTLRYRF